MGVVNRLGERLSGGESGIETTKQCEAFATA